MRLQADQTRKFTERYWELVWGYLERIRGLSGWLQCETLAVGGRRKWGTRAGKESAGGAGRTQRGWGLGGRTQKCPPPPTFGSSETRHAISSLGAGHGGKMVQPLGRVLRRTWNGLNFPSGNSVSPLNPSHLSRGLSLLRLPLQSTTGWAA